MTAIDRRKFVKTTSATGALAWLSASRPAVGQISAAQPKRNAILKPMDLEITVNQLKQQLASEQPPLLLDVREPWEYATAHIEGAKLMPMNEVPGKAFTELDEDQPIAVLCHHGSRSLSVANWLQQQGFSKAQSVAGGIDHWSQAIDPKVPRY